MQPAICWPYPALLLLDCLHQIFPTKQPYYCGTQQHACCLRQSRMGQDWTTNLDTLSLSNNPFVPFCPIISTYFDHKILQYWSHPTLMLSSYVAGECRPHFLRGCRCSRKTTRSSVVAHQIFGNSTSKSHKQKKTVGDNGWYIKSLSHLIQQSHPHLSANNSIVILVP